MSAFVVETETMTRAVKAILAKQYGSHVIKRFAGFDTETATAGRDIGRALFALNVSAVKQCYPDNAEMLECPDVETFDFWDFKPVSNAELIGCYKSLRCLAYQCAEGNITETDLYVAMTEAQQVLAEIIVSELPAYDAAPWG